MITYIHKDELETIARRVRYARWPKGSWACEIKQASFEDMGYPDMSTEFPMRSGEWVEAGKYEIRVSYRKWDIPAMIYVRKKGGKE